MRFSALIRGFLFFILCSLVFVAPAFAQSQTPIQSGQTYQNYQTNSYATPNNDPDVPNNLHTYSQNIVIEMLSAVACQLGGVDPSGPGQKCLGYDQKTNKIGFVENGGGALGVMDHLIAMTFTPPIHTSDYLSYLSHNFGLAKPAYAAPATGLGFSSLTPLVPMWTASRNIVYLVFVFAFILIGLGIMFRIKIDPRTVMSIQNQIPRIIVALLLVTFSLAIAGFLIDIMYVSIYLVYGLFQGAVQTAAPQALQGISPITLQGQSLPGVYAHMGSPTVFSMANNVALSFKDNVQSFLGVDGCPNVQECVKNVFNPLKVGWDIFGKGNDHSVANYIIDFISYGTGFGTFLRIMTVPNAVNEATPGISSLVSA
ncbi:MAG TPA: hypothetical protein VLF68_01075, partial [Candidatus Saccharimonadales bacterium]|nr:hypothetical protein [Candidatus Saccharimonadales bacterium]